MSSVLPVVLYLVYTGFGSVWGGLLIEFILWLQFEESMIVYDACRLIRERVPDAASGQRKCVCGWG